ncbi:hypothetical protein RchiOBHm_Chr5g0048301 [Rosa chinensis]|uniref:MCM10 OB-fold domain-containing protein n=1 Tax=Rosa chinensis TaxID=74649 RepID=A0A2P6QEK4_ROSCH|nr:hypothetical protein RchiOBHm_Chr5g0048301 [Rosa chinensis]
MWKQLLTPSELKDRFSYIRFVRLPNIKASSIGKSYSIYKFGCLEEDTVSVFLFGDDYERNCNEQAGMVFALFNCSVRKDAKNLRTGFQNPYQPKGVFMVDPLANRTNSNKSKQPVKLFYVEGIKKALKLYVLIYCY